MTSKQSEEHQGINVLFCNVSTGHQITLAQLQVQETPLFSKCKVQISLTFLTITLLQSSAGVRLCSLLAVVKAKYKQNNHSSGYSLDSLEFSAISLMIQMFMSQEISSNSFFLFFRLRKRSFSGDSSPWLNKTISY